MSDNTRSKRMSDNTRSLPASKKPRKAKSEKDTYTSPSVILKETSAPDLTKSPTNAINQRNAIEETLANARDTVARVTDAIDENKKVKEDAHLVIHQAFQALQQTLEQRKTTLLSELESISLSKITALTLEKEKYEKIEVASRILLTHTDDEIAAFGELIKMEPAVAKEEEPVSLPHSDIYVDVQIDGLIGELSKFGCISDLSLSLSSSTWSSTSIAKVNTGFHVMIQSKTSMGTVYPHGGLQMKAEMRSNTVYPHGGLQMMAEMRSNNGAVVQGNVRDHGDGIYTATLIPLTAGPHQLLITLNGQHLQNSPHDLNVLPVHENHDCSTLGKVLQVINCPKTPFSVAIGGYGGDLYVATNEDCLYVFDSNGYPKNTVGKRTLKDGLLFKCTNVGYRTLTNGTIWNGEPSLIIKNDILHLSNSGLGNTYVYRLTLQGDTINSFSSSGGTGLLIDEYNRIYVSNCSGNKIDVFNHNGGHLFSIDGNVTGGCSLESPYGLASDPLGNIHVATSGSNTIKVITKEGVYIRKYGDLKCPRGIAIDVYGYSFVTEYEGNCISIFDPQGNKIHTVGGPLHKPFGLALANNVLYIANSLANVVLKYDTCKIKRFF